MTVTANCVSRPGTITVCQSDALKTKWENNTWHLFYFLEPTGFTWVGLECCAAFYPSDLSNSHCDLCFPCLEGSPGVTSNMAVNKTLRRTKYSLVVEGSALMLNWFYTPWVNDFSSEEEHCLVAFGFSWRSNNKKDRTPAWTSKRSVHVLT